MASSPISLLFSLLSSPLPPSLLFSFLSFVFYFVPQVLKNGYTSVLIVCVFVPVIRVLYLCKCVFWRALYVCVRI